MFKCQIQCFMTGKLCCLGHLFHHSSQEGSLSLSLIDEIAYRMAEKSSEGSFMDPLFSFCIDVASLILPPFLSEHSHHFPTLRDGSMG